MSAQKQITAKIITDSLNPYGVRLTTFLLSAPRYILAEVNTHRALSRNAASSRAIPTAKLIDKIRSEGVEPVYWGGRKAGMQSGDEVDEISKEKLQGIWNEGKLHALATAEKLAAGGLAKQWANRGMEAYMQWEGLVSATEWDNFFSLRAHPDAQPDFQVLAYKMLDAYLNEMPKSLGWADWHIPFGDQMPEGLGEKDSLKVATARAARISYVSLGTSEINVAADILLHDRLLASGHLSPFEHAAQADENVTRSGNFGEGWRQYRKDFANENRKDINLYEVMATKPDWITL